MTERAIGQWTVDTLHEHLTKIIEANDHLYSERAAAADKAVNAAINAADRATTKAELAIEKRFEGVNELRGMAEDSQRIAMPRLEQETVNKALEDKILAHEKRLDQMRDQSGGKKELWGWIIGAVGIVLAVASWIMKSTP